MPRSLNISNLVFEVTRRCNMSCAHCLRGDAQDLDITESVIYKALKDVGSIDSLTLSGGEPSLNVRAMRVILNYCKDHDIPIDNFCIITNGKVLTNGFLSLIYDYYLYVCENDLDDISCVMVSQDKYHEKIDKANKTKLAGFTFYHNEKNCNYLINEGRARTIITKDKRQPYDYTSMFVNLDQDDLPKNAAGIDIGHDEDQDTYDIYEPEIYICANGDVKLGCDNSYDNIQNYIGSLHNKSLFEIIQHVYDEIISTKQRPLCIDPEDAGYDYHNRHDNIYEIVKKQADKRQRFIKLNDGSELRIQITDKCQCQYILCDKYQEVCVLTSDVCHDSLFEIAHICETLLFELNLKVN